MGEASPARVNSRNGYRAREWDTRVGTMEMAIPKYPPGGEAGRAPTSGSTPSSRRCGYASAAHLDGACGDILAFTVSPAKYDGGYC